MELGLVEEFQDRIVGGIGSFVECYVLVNQMQGLKSARGTEWHCCPRI